MKSIFNKPLLIALFSTFLFTSCTDPDDVNTLTVSVSNIDVPALGSISNFTIETNAQSWNIENPAAAWLTLSATTGNTAKAIIMAQVGTKTPEPRTAVLTITAGNAKPVTVNVSQAASEYLYASTSTVTSLSFKRAQNSIGFKVGTTAPQWEIECDAPWLTFNVLQGTGPETSVIATAAENTDTQSRETVIKITAQYTPTVEITVNQKGEYYPSYNTSPVEPDATGMESTASQIAQKIVLGWNLGNSLEATGGETAWGNPVTNQALINLVQNNGFNAVRIPCAWNGYLENPATAKIKQSWLERVKTVVQYCVNNQMYVVLNIHWDGGWLENNCTEAAQEPNNAKQKAFWEQIATYMRDFDEHLLFASANEPNVENATQMAVLNSYHQTFIDAVRSTGGKNAYRTLVVQGPSTDIVKTNNLMILPTDNVDNRLMVEVHYYTPWNLCGMTADADWGNMFYYWGNGYHNPNDPDRNATYGEEDELQKYFGYMKTKFVDKGYPVVLGEYGSIRRSVLTADNLTLHLSSRAYYHKYVTQQAKANGMIPFYWDNGDTGNNGFGIFNRKSLSVADQLVIDAMVEGAQ